MLLSYLRQYRSALLFALVTWLSCGIVLLLSALPVTPVLYGLGLGGAVGGVMLILGTVLRGRLLIAMGTGYAITDLWSIPIGLVFMMLGYWLDYTALLAGGTSEQTGLLFCIFV